MKSWLTRNAVWLGALGAIAGVLSMFIMLVPKEDDKQPSQDVVIEGNDSRSLQIQENSDGSQTAKIGGQGHNNIQKQ